MSRPYVMGDRMVLGEDLDDGTCLWKRRLLVRLWGVRGSVGDVLERRDFMLELKLTMSSWLDFVRSPCVVLRRRRLS